MNEVIHLLSILPTALLYTPSNYCSVSSNTNSSPVSFIFFCSASSISSISHNLKKKKIGGRIFFFGLFFVVVVCFCVVWLVCAGVVCGVVCGVFIIIFIII
jgi:hypothetical protein